MRRVIKIGGSLLLRDDLLSALPRWMDANANAEAETAVIVGGGELIDAIRNFDRVRGGDPVETHWICVDLLETTHRIFSQWFDWPCIGSPEDLSHANKNGFTRGSPTLVAVSAFYRRDHDTGARITPPLDWRTTTDAIAAVLADRIGADELVLLKSCDVDPAATIEQLTALGIVDQAFSTVAPNAISIRVEKLA